ncbi:hypothetical protein GCM10010174_00990 [Kutzneria viridogrisea]
MPPAPATTTLEHVKWGILAAAWAVLFAALHVYWALGGDLGLADSAGPELAAQRPTWFVLGCLWAAAACLLAIAVLAVAMRRWPNRLLLLACWAVAGLLLVRAVGVTLLLLTGAAEVSEGERFWSLVLWNPWFLLGGIAYLLAVRQPSRVSPAVRT